MVILRTSPATSSLEPCLPINRERLVGLIRSRDALKAACQWGFLHVLYFLGLWSKAHKVGSLPAMTLDKDHYDEWKALWIAPLVSAQ